ncbi:MAG: VacJ family lipoprotein [Pseudomonadota bacterium]
MKYGVSTVGVAVGLAFGLAACTTPDESVEIFDPYEERNRKVHDFNVSLDRNLVRPVARAYGEVLPGEIRAGVSNMKDFVSTPSYILNDVFQGSFEDAAHNTLRLAFNGVFGFGLLDSASAAGVERRPSDFGQTLHVWGAPEGAYIESPFIGPSTERDTIGTVVDIVTNPTAYALDRSIIWVSPGVTAGDVLQQRYEFGDTVDSLLDDSADSYAQTRSIYLQNRRFELGQDDEFEFDPYEDLFDE